MKSDDSAVLRLEPMKPFGFIRGLRFLWIIGISFISHRTANENSLRIFPVIITNVGKETNTITVYILIKQTC